MEIEILRKEYEFVIGIIIKQRTGSIKRSN